ncbi:radical SAM/SPASM domain-containing protein [Rhizobium ruizarguesonis]
MNNRLIEVDLNVTDRCNLTCTYCSVPVTSVRDSSPELTLHQLARLFDEFEELGVKLLRLAGGEPFVRRDIEAILELAGHRSFKTIVLTNGLPVQLRHVELASRLPSVDSFAFSVDGASAGEHWRSRGCSGSFDRIVRAIQHCIDVGLKHSMMTVVTGNVVNNLKQLVELAASYEMYELRFILPGYTGSARNRPDAFPVWSDWKKAIVDLTRFLADAKDLPKVHVLFPHEDPVPLELYQPLFDAGLVDELERVWNIPWALHGRPPSPGQSHCRAGKSNLTILPNGDAYGCDLMRNIPDLKCGNVITEGVGRVFDESKVLKILRNVTTVNGCANFDETSQTFACGQCRAGSRELSDAGLHAGGVLPVPVK